MADTQIQIGSVVELKSGGPEMTVVNKDGPRWVCGWYERIHGDMRYATFWAEALKIIR
jgi:uncharacterized protein YodC (DUF2158 family)